MTTVDYHPTQPVFKGLSQRYIVSDGTATPVSSGWIMPETDFTTIESNSLPVDRARAKYRKVLASLAPQNRTGDPSVLLVELAASETDISEAENLRK